MAAVTAIIPAYERPETVRTAIEHALAQTFTDLQVLVGDDSRSDAVQQVVASFDDPRVMYHRNSPSLGAMQNWVDLVHRADTEFLASLNDDDFWEPEFLERLVTPMLSDQRIGLAFCDTWYVDERGDRMPAESQHWSHVSHRDSLPAGQVAFDAAGMLRLIAVWNAPQPAYAAVIRRDAVVGIEFPRETDPCHDLWCTYRIWTQGYSFHFVPERLTDYRIHAGNLTNAGFAAAEDFIFGQIVAEQADNPAVEELQQRWARIRFTRAATALAAAGGIAVARGEFAAAAPSL
ncbi:MAG: glycosyltransferase, partial [Ilumatobacteraceae bacterium]